MGKIKAYLMELEEDGVKIEVNGETHWISIEDADDLLAHLSYTLQDARIEMARAYFESE